MIDRPFAERVTGGVVGVAGEAHGAGKINPAVIRTLAQLLAAAYPHADFDTGVNYMQGQDTVIIDYEPSIDPAVDGTELKAHQARIAEMIVRAFASVG